VILRHRTLVRAAFCGFAALLFIGTHWPKLTIPAPGRPDLVVHMTIFAMWTALLIACGFFGPPLSGRNLGIVLAIAPVYAAVDESLQAIPWVRRHAAWDDYLMNVSGILLALAAAAVFSALLRKQGGPGARIGPGPSPSSRNPGAS
jgi:hypothetical protein